MDAVAATGVTSAGGQAQANYAWMRSGLRGLGCEINHYVRASVLVEVHENLLEYVGEEMLNRFKAGPFGKLLQLRRKASQNNALHELVAREITHPIFTEHEKWFHIGGRHIRFGPEDYALVTGLVFGAVAFNPNKKHHILESSLLRKKYNGERIKVSTLRRDFNYGQLQTPTDYVKAENLLVYYLMLLCRDNPWIDDWIWVLVEDEVGWGRFPWGSYSFQILCHQIAVLPKQTTDIHNHRNSYSFFGPVWAFNIWAYEALPELGYLYGRQRSQTLTPRFLRWITQRSNFDYIDFFEEFQLKCIFPLLPDSSELLVPYFLSSISSNALVVRYHPSKRHAYKKIPPCYRGTHLQDGNIKVSIRMMKRSRDMTTSTFKSQPRDSTSQAEVCLHGQQCVICLGGSCWIDRMGDLVCRNLAREIEEDGFFNFVASKIAGQVNYWLHDTSPDETDAVQVDVKHTGCSDDVALHYVVVVRIDTIFRNIYLHIMLYLNLSRSSCFKLHAQDKIKQL